MANESQECLDLREELRDARDELDALVREAQSASPEEQRRLLREISRQRQLVRELQHAVFVACQPAPPTPNLRTVGIEETQATQFFQSLLIPCPDLQLPSRCTDNAIPLVAGKATVLRAYVDMIAQPTKPITALTGVLEAKPSGGTTNFIPLTPYNAPVPPRSFSQ